MEHRFTKPSAKVAAFDLDYTLLKPASGKKFPINRDDAMLMYPKVKTKLLQLVNDGYKIVVFTNQKGIGRYLKATDIYYKINKYLPKGKDCDVYMSYKSGKYRKPCPGMFDAFMEENGAVVDIFYVGDAAGRNSDFSASDAQFAHNCDIPFYTPEEYFLDQPQQIPTIKLLDKPQPIPFKQKLATGNVVILVGPPGCGKSTFAKELQQQYNNLKIVNNDSTGSAAKSMKLFKSVLGKKVIVVDNTNATVANRQAFITLARKANCKVIIVTMLVERDLALHLNNYRAYTNGTDPVPAVAFASYYKRYQPVSPTEANVCLEYTPNYPSKIFEYSL